MAKNSGHVDSGLASVLTSASGASTKWSRTMSSNVARRSPPSSDGVPPPTYTVCTVGASSLAAASSSSARSASSQRSGLTPPSWAGV
ncbi:Uncharacterised protein [Mycobacterium tuberculosis]|uniref:Uncharacterized protein n=1 Tax=Mycobacterium tuberculosis TaxID=1773 RepID=A0A654TWS7_MYCTX|nr:Uncharacterised protein [Mycobacterium tuberculosis]CKO33206.1 Uncharacterised protein [Mycobacterium tuberculosis]COU84176.1 Uncharacterised protein [Mycobacterium tuberculosis]COU96058.1 Uncharacterised protein [Mycobacterium tuberculosis]COV22022.1 Uncharacterised protein [Mycobacterium tuberculosis]